MRRFRVGCIVLGLLLAVPTLAATVDKTFHETFEASSATRLRVEHDDGDVRVTPWDRDQVEIHVRYRAEIKRVGLGGSDPDFDVRFSREGDTIRVVGQESGTRGLTIGYRSKRYLEYVYEIKAPAGTELSLSGEDGDVEIHGWRGDIVIELDDGDVRFEDVTSRRARLRLEDGDFDGRHLSGGLDLQCDDGDVTLDGYRAADLRLRLEDGDVEISDASGRFEITVDDGDVILAALSADELRVRTEDGDVRVELLAAKTVQLTTDDGGVDVTLAGSLSTRFDVETDDGRIDLELKDVDDLQRHKRRASGSLHGGLGTLRVNVGDANIRLQQR
ncbi:MAG: DUF4097 domain-containing protein [bacterium]|nr:DUF4097 domain-containing protein [bacterium]